MHRVKNNFLSVALFLLLLLPCSGYAAENEAWHDGSRKVRLWRHGYSLKHQSSIYGESANSKAPKQALSGRIIVVFHQDKSHGELESFMEEHKLVLVRKLSVGTATYLFKTEGDKDSSLTTANLIYKSGKVKASYPDWIYTHRLF